MAVAVDRYRLYVVNDSYNIVHVKFLTLLKFHRVYFIYEKYRTNKGAHVGTIVLHQTVFLIELISRTKLNTRRR